jgi:hypothetical protein
MEGAITRVFSGNNRSLDPIANAGSGAGSGTSVSTAPRLYHSRIVIFGCDLERRGTGDAIKRACCRSEALDSSEGRHSPTAARCSIVCKGEVVEIGVPRPADPCSFCHRDVHSRRKPAPPILLGLRITFVESVDPLEHDLNGLTVLGPSPLFLIALRVLPLRSRFFSISSRTSALTSLGRCFVTEWT